MALTFAAKAIEYSLDPAPQVTLRSRTDVLFQTVRETTDGHIVMQGVFDYLDGASQSSIARLNADGSLDATFTLPTMNGGISRIAPTGGNKLIVLGSFSVIGGENRPGFARLNADGTVDATFTPSEFVPPPVRDVVGLPDGGCYVFEGFVPMRVRRFTSTGSLDPAHATVNVNQFSVAHAVGSNGELAFVFANIPGPAALEVFDPSGAATSQPEGIPSSFMPFSVTFDPDGSVVLSGTPSLIRLLADGQLDNSFGLAGSPTGFGGTSLIRLANGSYVTTGPTGPGAPAPHLLHFDADGNYVAGLSVENSLDGYPANLAVLPLANGDFLLNGRFLSVDSVISPMIARISPADVVRTDFVVDVLTRGRTSAILPFGSGGHLVGGNFTEVNGASAGNLALFQSDDSIATSLPIIPFGAAFAVGTSDGGAIVFGGFPSLSPGGPTGVARITPAGTIDHAFLANVSLFGFATGAPLANGGVILAGNFGQFPTGPNPPPAKFLTRVLPDGSIDPVFYNESTVDGGFNGIPAVGIDPAGRIIVAGQFSAFQGVPRAGLARTSPDGVIDMTFQSDVSVSVFAPQMIQVLSDGRFYLLGDLNGGFGRKLMRFNADGSLDTSFVLPIQANEFTTAYALAADGSLFVAAGSLVTGVRVIHVLEDGQLDPTFNCTLDSGASALLVDSHGRLWIGGGFTKVNGQAREGVARFSPAGFGISIEGPGELTVPKHTNLILSSNVFGAPGTPSYQWFRDGHSLHGETGPTLTLTHIVPKHEGHYTVTATVGAETVTSAPMHLIVQRGKPAK